MSASPGKIEGMREEQGTPSAPRHLFYGTRRYRATLLGGAVLAAILLATMPALTGATSNWALALCPWFGVVSAVVFAVLLAADLFKPQALTRGLVRIALGLLVASAGLAISFMMVGFAISA